MVDSGEILSLIDEIAIKTRTQGQGIIFTGQPRKLPEAQYFLQKDYIDIVFFLDAPVEVLKDRALSRGRADDDAATVINRIKVYLRETYPVLDYFYEQGIPVYKINAHRTRDEIDMEILQFLMRHHRRLVRTMTAYA